MRFRNNTARSILCAFIVMLGVLTPAWAQTSTHGESADEGFAYVVGNLGYGAFILDTPDAFDNAPQRFIVGYRRDANGTVIVTGNMTVGDRLRVGLEGVGSLTIHDTGVLNVLGPTASIGLTAGSTGVVTVKDGGSLSSAGRLDVARGIICPGVCGEGGINLGIPGETTLGTLNVTGGSSVDASELRIAHEDRGTCQEL